MFVFVFLFAELINIFLVFLSASTSGCVHLFFASQVKTEYCKGEAASEWVSNVPGKRERTQTMARCVRLPSTLRFLITLFLHENYEKIMMEGGA